MTPFNRTAPMLPKNYKTTTSQGAYCMTLCRSDNKTDVASAVTEGLQTPTLVTRLLGKGKTTEETDQKQAIAINSLVYMLTHEQDHDQELRKIEDSAGKSALAVIDSFFEYPNGIPPCYLEDDSRALNFEGESLHATLKEAEENGDNRFTFIRSQLTTRSRASQHRLVRTISGNEATLLLPEDGGEYLGKGSSGYANSAEYHSSYGTHYVACKTQRRHYETLYAQKQYQKLQAAQYNAAETLYENGFRDDDNLMRIYGMATIDDMDAIILEKCDHLPERKTQQELISGVKQMTALVKRLLDKNIRQNDVAERNIMRKGSHIKLIDLDFVTQATKEQEELLGLTDYPRLFDDVVINYQLKNMQELDNETATTAKAKTKKAKTNFLKLRLKSRRKPNKDVGTEEKRLEHNCREEIFVKILQDEEENMYVDNIVYFIQDETEKIDVSHVNGLLDIYQDCIDIQRKETKLRRVHATLQYLNILPSQELDPNDLKLMRRDLKEVYLGATPKYQQDTPKERLEAYAKTLARDIKREFNSLSEDISIWPDNIEEENASACVIS